MLDVENTAENAKEKIRSAVIWSHRDNYYYHFDVFFPVIFICMLNKSIHSVWPDAFLFISFCEPQI